MALMANSAVFGKCHPYLNKRIKAVRTTWTYLKKYASVSGNVFWHQMWYVKADLELDRHSYMLFVHFKKSLFLLSFSTWYHCFAWRNLIMRIISLITALWYFPSCWSYNYGRSSSGLGRSKSIFSCHVQR